MFSDKTCGKLLFETLEVKESFPTFLLLSFWKTAHLLSDFFKPQDMDDSAIFSERIW